MINWSSGFCETSRINIHYTRTGGQKPPLILLHGLMTNGLCWTDLARDLEAEYDVIMPDARGHGKSSAPDSGYGYEDQADDVADLVRVLGLPKPCLLGHSMGGMTAALLASRKPNLLRGLILADPTFLSEKMQREVYNSGLTAQHRKILSLPLNEVIAAAKARHPNRSLETIELFARARLQTSIDAFKVLRPPNPDYKQLVGGLRIPSLLIFGDKGIISSAVAEELQRVNPTLHTQQIQEARHALHLDQPECFSTVVKTFLRSIEAGIRE